MQLHGVELDVPGHEEVRQLIAEAGPTLRERFTQMLIHRYERYTYPNGKCIIYIQDSGNGWDAFMIQVPDQEVMQ